MGQVMKLGTDTCDGAWGISMLSVFMLSSPGARGECHRSSGGSGLCWDAV